MDPVSIGTAVVKTAPIVQKAAGTLLDVYKRTKDGMTASLTEFTKDSNIIMRLYIDQRLAGEDITPSICNMLNQLVTGYILTALNMNELVQGGKTVRQLLRVVATESFVDAVRLIETDFADLDDTVVSMEEAKTLTEEEKRELTGDVTGVKPIETNADQFYSGRILELTLGTKGGTTVKAYVYVQLLPYLLSPEVIAGFVRLNFTAPWYRRLNQYRAGEIRFWKDLIFSADEVANRAKSLRADKDGILVEIEDYKAKQQAKRVKQMAIGEVSHNLANAILVTESTSFYTVANERGMNIKDFAQRQRFFKESMTTMLCIVDVNYSIMELYMAGIESRGEYTFSMIKSACRGKDSLDLKAMLTLLAAGQAPKF